MFKRLILILGCLLGVFSLTTSDEVPTIAISCGNTLLTTLPIYQQSIDTLEFTKLLSSFWNEHTKVVMVLEDELSLEDFTAKDTNGKSLFKLFENAKNLRFFPSVNQPEKAVEMLSNDDFSIKAYNDNIYNNSTEKMLALADLHENNHNKDDETRQLMLIRHNDYVSKMFNNLCEQHKNIVLIFSGKLNPWIGKSETSNAHHLVTRHLMTIDEPPTLLIKDPKGKSLIYSASYPMLSINNDQEIQLKDTIPEVFIDDSRESLLKITKTFLANDTKVILRFRFERTTFTWELKSIEYESVGSNDVLFPQSFIGAQKGLSYFSEGPVVFSSNSIVLTFNDKFQVQPWITKTTRDLKFSDPHEQDPFFTPPILAGLFVIALMLFIVTWGTTMIMDIKTMDRFDDPKGKTISINVVE